MTNAIARRIMLLAATATLAVGARSAFATELPSGPVPNTFGVQLKEDNLDEADLDAIQKLGIKVVRRGFLWQNVEKEKGVYDFSRYEKLVDDCEKRGLRVMACLALNNSKLYPHVKDPEGREAYVKYAVAAVEKFKGRNILWELWNEPNVMTFWGKHGKVGNSEQYAEEYYQLVKAVVPAMKQADPDCLILGGSVSNLWIKSYEWQTFVFNKGILKTGIDVWSVHPYGLKSPEDNIEGYAEVRKRMKDSGNPVMTMLNSERGFDVTGKGGEGDAGGKAAQRLEDQARHVVRQYLVDQLTDMKLTIWYEWSGKEGFALLNPDGTESPAFKSTKVLIDQLTGYTLDKRLPPEDGRDFVVRYKDDKGNAKLIVWTAPPPMKTPDQTVDHEIEIPIASAQGTLQTVDMYGKAGEVELKDGKVTMMLTGAPQYIILPAK